MFVVVLPVVQLAILINALVLASALFRAGKSVYIYGMRFGNDSRKNIFLCFVSSFSLVFLVACLYVLVAIQMATDEL